LGSNDEGYARPLHNMNTCQFGIYDMITIYQFRMPIRVFSLFGSLRKKHVDAKKQKQRNKLLSSLSMI
ncbi:MAG: hypothetical protein WA323_12660, partial [Candidatus Nitrosopolaris sp.]